MAIKRIFDFPAVAALAPAATAPRTLQLRGMPRGKRLARIWIWARLTLTRGVGAIVHQPQGIASFISQINGTVGRHSWSITDGRDLYVYQEIAQGSIFGQNAAMTAAAETYDLLFPIPTSYILGGPGELATRPPTEEFEGGSLNLVFTNPFSVATDVNTVACNDLAAFVEYYERGEAATATQDPEIKKLANWGGFWGSRTPPTGTIFQITDIVANFVAIKQRGWTTMQLTANGEQLYTNILPEQLPMLDSDRFNRFQVDPILSYNLANIVRPGMPIESNIPTAGAVAATEDWTKLFDGRNDRDAAPPLVFQSDAAFDFAGAGAVVVGRRASTGTVEVRV